MENLIFGVIGFFVGYWGANFTMYLKAQLMLKRANKVLASTERMMKLLEELKGIHEDIKNINLKPDELL